MRVVVIIDGAGDADTLAAQIGFHLAAGVDAALVRQSPAVASDVLRRFEGHDAVRLVESPQDEGDVTTAQLAYAALDEFGADWVIEARAGEFWWPRGESFQDVLAPMPPRYGVVQGLRRLFVPRPADAHASRDSTTIRRSFLVVPPEHGTVPENLLRPAYRAHPALDPERPGGGPGTRQPLRAWYPLEVLTLPVGDDALSEDDVALGLADGSLVVDERLRHALDAIDRGELFSFSVPDVVDDAAYAGECAAVGEVDLEKLDQQIRELERRIVELEARFWPRVQRVASRIVRRGSPS